MKVVSKFCYLGDMLSSGGGCTQAVIARCRVAWGKFKLLLVLSHYIHRVMHVTKLRNAHNAPYGHFRQKLGSVNLTKDLV